MAAIFIMVTLVIRWQSGIIVPLTGDRKDQALFHQNGTAALMVLALQEEILIRQVEIPELEEDPQERRLLQAIRGEQPHQA